MKEKNYYKNYPFPPYRRTNLSNLTHSAKIIKINSNSVEVQICRPEACSGCAVKSACQLKNNHQQQLLIPTKDTSNYYIDQLVMIEISPQTGLHAILYAYIIPLILMLSTLIITIQITSDELTAGFFSIFVLAPYYIALFLCKKHLNQKFSFKILEK